jgi:hypothetical protein
MTAVRSVILAFNSTFRPMSDSRMSDESRNHLWTVWSHVLFFPEDNGQKCHKFSTLLGSRDDHPDVAKELNYRLVPHI